MNDEQLLKDAQYRKSLSISFFNATNSAISLVATEKEVWKDEKAMLDTVVRYRNFFLEEHKNYYAQNIANVGQNYKSKDTIEKLKTAKTLEELKSLWISLSEDERRDGEIIKEVNLLKKQYEKV